MAGVNPDPAFWKGKKVFITGHTGFKGSWLILMLHQWGAEITGYALDPITKPNLYNLINGNELVNSIISDIRDYDKLIAAVQKAKPEIVIHLAAQPLVRESYRNPRETYEINVMGTVNLLEAIKIAGSVKAVLNVTTDKCYENREWYWGYRENEPMGGYDPYSNSKACSELVTTAFRNSFFNTQEYKQHGLALATARAGNVIGGGDWADDRLIADFFRAILMHKKVKIRSPYSIRPWQHVLEPLAGYLILCEKLYSDGPSFAEAWNFGPDDKDARNVKWVIEKICKLWGNTASYEVEGQQQLHEAKYLKLDCSKAKQELGWRPRWSLDTTLCKIIEWNKAFVAGENITEVCLNQISNYFTNED